MVENPEPAKEKETANGDGNVKSEDRVRSRSSKCKSDEKVEDYDDDGHRSRGSKSRDESRNHDRRKERDSSCHRSWSRDGGRDRPRSSWEHRDRDTERDRDRDREERNGRDRNRDRGRDRDRRERDHDTERDREKDKEKEREKSHRSGSQSERYRSDRDERERSRDREVIERERSRDREVIERERSRDREVIERERSRDRELKEREKERESRDNDKESRRPKEKKEQVEPEVDPERDQRTVFAYQICLKADERDVYEFFSRAGKVRDVRLIMDRNSRRSKGVGYVEFYDVMSVPMAIALSGQPLLGQPVMVKPSEAEKNLVQSNSSIAGASGGGTGPYSGGARRLYVGNLHFNMTEDQLRQVFEPFGTVELVQLPLDETGHCKGFGFVQFARLEDARNALNLNGQLEIVGRAIKVSAVTDQSGLQDLGANTTGDFDDDEGGGLSLNARSRALLMQKLDRSGSATTIAGSAVTPAVNSTALPLPTAPLLGAASAVSTLVPPLVQGTVPTHPGQLGTALQVPTASVPIFDTIGVPSECLLLKNMFDPKNETYEEFDMDIKEDVEGECSKFGKLKHIFVEKDSAGFVYLRFENTQSAFAAQRALHGRWFAGKMITATFMVTRVCFRFPCNNYLVIQANLCRSITAKIQAPMAGFMGKVCVSGDALQTLAKEVVPLWKMA
ncbi:splicing factor CC1-like protein [Citrus sinensis]|nr:splicing factor CC1-like protein [Citrus sinensis]